MNMSEFFFVSAYDHIVSCPNCGDSHYESNRFEELEALLREAADEAPRLVFEGKQDEAVELLIAFYAVKIVNDTRPEHFCLSCGITFCA